MGDVPVNAADRATVRAALDHLDATCRYHGESLERVIGFAGLPQACCDTGKPALARRQALAVLDAEADTQKATA